MAEITLRTAGSIASANATVKGSPLTNLEVDNNFSNINIVVDGLSNVFGITTGQATITGNLVPAAANTYDLGTAAAPFRDLYVSGNSIKLGSITLSTLGGNIALDGTEVLSASGGAVPADASIDAAKLATGAVTEDKIDTGAVTNNKLGTNAITENKISSGAVTSGKLQDYIDIGAANATSLLMTGDGSVSAPAIAFSNDTNTGIFRDGADNLVFATGGVARANVNSSGFLEANFKDKVVDLGNSGTSANIDLTQGTVFTATLTGNCTFDIQNAQTGSSFVLQLTNDATPGRSVAFTGGTNFRYPFGAQGRSTDANAIDIWYFATFDGGTNWVVALPIKSAATL